MSREDVDSLKMCYVTILVAKVFGEINYKPVLAKAILLICYKTTIEYVEENKGQP